MYITLIFFVCKYNWYKNNPLTILEVSLRKNVANALKKTFVQFIINVRPKIIALDTQ